MVVCEGLEKSLKRRCFVETLAALLGKGFSDFFSEVEVVLTDILGGPRKWPLDTLRCMKCMMEGSHSLGKLIEWKLFISMMALKPTLSSPHSLGKLIEWKLLSALSLLGIAMSPLAGETN